MKSLLVYAIIRESAAHDAGEHVPLSAVHPYAVLQTAVYALDWLCQFSLAESGPADANQLAFAFVNARFGNLHLAELALQ